MKCLFVDHDDSFSYNVINYLKTEPFPIEVDHHHFKKIQSSMVCEYDLIVLGPGPLAPREVMESVQLVKEHIHTIPFLGICLGMQILNVATGGSVVRSKSSHHGSSKEIKWSCPELSTGTLKVGSYNSLTNTHVSKDWAIIAEDSCGEVQSMVSNVNSICSIGIQFHPESFLSEDSSQLKTWMTKKLFNEV